MSIGMNMSYKRLFNFVLLGDSGVGKSSLILRFADDTFIENRKNQMEIYFKKIFLNMENETICLQLWNISSKDLSEENVKSILAEAHVLFLVYCINKRESFQSVNQWVDAFKHFYTQEQISSLSMVLLGNKCDLERERKVSIEECEKYAQENLMTFCEASAYLNIKVDKCFQHFLTHLVENTQKDSIIKKNTK